MSKAIELVDGQPFDPSTGSALPTALRRAVAEQDLGGDVGEVPEPVGEYADLLALVCDANGFAFRVDLLTTLHDGLWEVMREDATTGAGCCPSHVRAGAAHGTATARTRPNLGGRV
jgi:hypothetical protein